MRNLFKLSPLAFSFLVTAPTVVMATQTEVNLSSYTNATASSAGLDYGSYLPAAGSTLTVGGVNFLISSYNGATGAGSMGLFGTYFAPSVTISTNISDPATIYTVVNSFYGEAPNTVGEIKFTDAAGDTYTYSYTEGMNLRDYYYNVYNDLAPDVYGTAYFNGTGYQSSDRLDVQKITLPAGFASSTLTSITFEGVGSYGNPDGAPFLVAITAATAVSSVPEPSTWALSMAGIGGLGLALRRARKTSRHAAQGALAT